MRYTFNFDENFNKNNENLKSKNIQKHFKIYNIISNYGNSLAVVMTLALYLLTIIISSYNNDFILNNLHFILKIILCFCISKIIFQILEIFFNVEKIYYQITDFLGFDIFVRNLTVFNDSENDKLKESEIVPAIKIEYDIKKESNQKFALIFQMPDETFKVVDIIDCDGFKTQVEKKIYSDKILKCIRETENKCVDENGLLLAKIVLLNNDSINTNEIITKNDIDEHLLLTEIFFFPFVHKKGEGNV